MTIELRLVVKGQLLTSEGKPLLADFLKFAGMSHSKRISWDVLGFDPDVDMVTAQQRLEWDSKIPPQKLPPPGLSSKEAHKTSVRESLYRAISECRTH